MKLLRFIRSIIIGCFFFAFTPAFGTNYYISSLNGNDANNGTSSATPWKTLTRLQQAIPSLNPGDIVHFHRGSIWHETSLVINRRSGTAGSPIVFKAYGEGPRPVLSGSKTISNFESSGNIYSAPVYKDFPHAPLSVPTGILINGEWKDIARSPEYMVYGSGASDYIYDQARSWQENRYTGSLILIQPVHWHWTPSPITYNSSNTLGFLPVQHSSSTDKEVAYYIANHEDFLTDPGDWVFRNRTLKVYYPTDLNQQNVQFAVSDTILTIWESSNLVFQDIVFEMANFRHFVAHKGSDISISGCEFRYTAGESVMFLQTDNIHFNGNYIHDCGAVGLRLTWFGYAEVRNNLFRRIAADHVGMANYNFRMGAALTLNYSFKPMYHVEYNYFDSVGLAIQSHTFSSGGSVSIRYNYIENYGITISDCGALYFNSDMGAAGLRYVKYNTIRNAVTAGNRYSTNFHPVLHPHAIYCDEGALGYYCDSNTIENTNYALYMNRNYKNTLINSNIVNANQFNPEFYNAVFMKDQAIGPTNFSADKDTIRNNNIVLSPNSNPRVYLRHESVESQEAWVDENLFYYDYNKIADPFHSGTPNIGRYILNWHYADYDYTLDQMRTDGGRVSNIPTDQHSVIDPQGIEYASVSGSVSQEDFVKLFTNFSKYPRYVSLGSATFRDMDGNSVSGSITVPPFYSKILFYQSGNINTVGPEHYVDSTLIPAFEAKEVSINHPPVISDSYFTIYEATQTDLYIGTVAHSDADDTQGHSFTIVSGNPSGLFRINHNGSIYFTTSEINYSGNPVYNLRIRITDNGVPPLSAEAMVRIALYQIETNLAPIIENQSFEYYAEQEQTLAIGKLTAHDPNGDQITYELVSGDIDNISVNAQTGELSFIEIPDIEVPTAFEFIARVSDFGVPALTDEAFITVVYIPLNFTVFIDPSASSEGDGSYAHPYKSFDQVEFQEDHSYLVKRGTVLPLESLMLNADRIEISAYGEGELPVLQSSATSYVIFSADRHDITVKNLEIAGDKALSALYFIGPQSKNIHVSNCIISGAEYGLRFINTGNTLIEYCQFRGNHQAAYVLGSAANFYYNIFADNYSGLSLSVQNSTTNIYNNVFYNNREAVNFSGLQLNLRNNVICLTENEDKAVRVSASEYSSDHNIYFPERDHFVAIGNDSYSTLADLREFADLGQHSMVLDPCFIQPGQVDFNLAEHSPAIDAGIYVGLNYDINGIPIPVGHAPDIGIVEFSAHVGTVDSMDDIAGNPFRIHPNPASTIVFINAAADFKGNETLNLYNAYGHLLQSVRVDDNRVDLKRCYLDISTLSPGLYVITISGEREQGSVKFIKGD